MSELGRALDAAVAQGEEARVLMRGHGDTLTPSATGAAFDSLCEVQRTLDMFEKHGKVAVEMMREQSDALTPDETNAAFFTLCTVLNQIWEMVGLMLAQIDRPEGSVPLKVDTALTHLHYGHQAVELGFHVLSLGQVALKEAAGGCGR